MEVRVRIAQTPIDSLAVEVDLRACLPLSHICFSMIKSVEILESIRIQVSLKLMRVAETKL